MKEEKRGYNVIISEIDSDILNTLDTLNKSKYSNESQELFKIESNLTIGRILEDSEYFLAYLESFFVMKESLFLFSYNPLYLNYTLEEMERQDLKMRYLQMDSNNKCVPPDWYIGYDTFVIYSFFQITGN